MRIYFATQNIGKFKSAEITLSKYGLEMIQIPLDLPESRSDDLKEIAREKILFAYQTIKKPCLVHDGGFFIPALKNFPGPLTHFVLEAIGLEGILKLVGGKPRACEGRNCLAYLGQSLSRPKYFESTIKGKLSQTSRGETKDYFWSDLFLIFIPQGESKTLGEMTREEYHRWRERGYSNSCTYQFAEWVSKK